MTNQVAKKKTYKMRAPDEVIAMAEEIELVNFIAINGDFLKKFQTPTQARTIKGIVSPTKSVKLSYSKVLQRAVSYDIIRYYAGVGYELTKKGWDILFGKTTTD